jgi:hypothetical protein
MVQFLPKEVGEGADVQAGNFQGHNALQEAVFGAHISPLLDTPPQGLVVSYLK